MSGHNRMNFNYLKRSAIGSVLERKTSETVSYTHLDVYKRQTQQFDKDSIRAEEIAHCQLTDRPAAMTL